MQRFRHLRATPAIREKHAEVTLAADDLIYPYFVREGIGIREEIGSMPGICRYSVDTLLEDIAEISGLGINKVLLFGVVDRQVKDARGTIGLTPDSIVCRAVREIKKAHPHIFVITDVCLCEYTDHGHCGLLCGHDVDNDATLPLLAEMALLHARAGADCVAPSAMMDGQVEAIRRRLDSEGLRTKVLGYSAKYASAFYGPFREAAGSAPSFGDRRSYQMDYRTGRQALEEIAADIDEGADWVMVKPAMAYLDIIQRARMQYPDKVITAYQVSGEYAMLKAGAAAGYFDEGRIFHEALTAIKRAGAKYIISYYAKEFLGRGLYKLNY